MDEYKKISKEKNRNKRYLRWKFSQLCEIKRSIPEKYLNNRSWKKYPTQSRSYIDE